MPETLTMSKKETERLKVIGRIEHEEMTIVDAAECLHISERHMYRILRRYHAKGESGLLHRLLDGSLHIFWNDNELKFVKLTKKPEHKKRTSKPPAANYPWRKKLIGKFPNQKKGLASDNFKPYRKPSTSGTVARRRRKDSTRYARSVFPSGNTSP